jgi:hypothetical protein
MIKRKMNYHLHSAKDLLEKFPEEASFKRIGIIPYFLNNEDLFLFLMLDSKFGELTDCGGLPKNEEHWIDTAIRETEEESRNFFSFSKEFILDHGTVFFREDHSIAIIFMNISCKISTIEAAEAMCYKYRKSYLRGITCKDKRHRLENSDMFFYSLAEITVLAKQKKQIYYPVKMLLLKFIHTRVKDRIQNQDL